MWLVSSAIIFQSIILQCDFRVFFSPSHHRLLNKDFTLTRALQEKDIRTRDGVDAFLFIWHCCFLTLHLRYYWYDLGIVTVVSLGFPSQIRYGNFHVYSLIAAQIAICMLLRFFGESTTILWRERGWWTTHFLHSNLNETDAEKERESCLCRGQSL